MRGEPLGAGFVGFDRSITQASGAHDERAVAHLRLHGINAADLDRSNLRRGIEACRLQAGLVLKYRGGPQQRRLRPAGRGAAYIGNEGGKGGEERATSVHDGTRSVELVEEILQDGSEGLA
ncbi:hypothetical protein GCM10007276_34320 [Agaricicola taiwanensis]|uniref:Uncharacterized protein n=1 Tax=Agaricicola taiwanensis TaxID=591372 RepID=A0A8J2YMF6_9RHOB|nr:hypothetical protein GCM10007276_34320 [Agaricicola taiwanensis]